MVSSSFLYNLNVYFLQTVFNVSCIDYLLKFLCLYVIYFVVSYFFAFCGLLCIARNVQYLDLQLIHASLESTPLIGGFRFVTDACFTYFG